MLENSATFSGGKTLKVIFSDIMYYCSSDVYSVLWMYSKTFLAHFIRIYKAIIFGFKNMTHRFPIPCSYILVFKIVKNL
jgi:hypothetical protein